MTEPGPGGYQEYRGARLRRGTRLIRLRSARRVPWQGQPDRPATHPAIPHRELPRHTCAECFGPRSHYSQALFCSRCERELFGRNGYQSFIRSERARNLAAARKRVRKAAQ
jgi:hypothetical protein